MTNLPEAIPRAKTWADLVCLHSVLNAVCGVEDPQYEDLTLVIAETPQGDNPARPFELYGRLIFEVRAHLLEVFEDSRYIYEDEFVDMFRRSEQASDPESLEPEVVHIFQHAA